MSFSRRIALRYLTTKRSEAFISILTLISTVALAIGVAVLVVVMSIMNGFEYELKNKLLGANAHISVRALRGSLFRWSSILDFVEQEKDVQQTAPIESISPYSYNQGLLQVEKRSTGVLVKGIRVNDAAGLELSEKLVPNKRIGEELFSEPELLPEQKEESSSGNLAGIVIGKELADSMLLRVGDVVTILSPQLHSSPFGLMPRFRRFRISGIYSTGLVEYESSLLYMDMAVAQKFFRLGDSVAGLEIRLKNLDKAHQAAPILSSALSEKFPGVYAQSWTETHKNLWEALQLERTAYFTVLLLLVVMASFSIVSTLVMLVLEKRKDIAVLRTLGATEREVGSIFRITGMTIGVVGTVSGLLLGLLLNLALKTYGFPLPEKIFPVSELPVRMEPLAFVVTGTCALVICLLATLYPVRRASRLRPTELLRYE